MKKTISFDLWNTLIQSNPKFQEARLKMIASYTRLSEDKITKYLKLFKYDIDTTCEKFGIQPDIDVAFSNLYNLLEIDSRLITVHDFKNEYHEIFENYPAVLCTISKEDRMLLKTITSKKYLFERENTIAAILEILSEKYNLVITSNTVLIPGEILRRTLYNRGIKNFFSEMYFSDESTHCKPHPEFFSKMHYNSGSLKRNIIHIGDNIKTDIEGALNYGLNTIQITDNDLSTVVTDIETIFNNKHKDYLLNHDIL